MPDKPKESSEGEKPAKPSLPESKRPWLNPEVAHPESSLDTSKEKGKSLSNSEIEVVKRELEALHKNFNADHIKNIQDYSYLNKDHIKKSREKMLEIAGHVTKRWKTRPDKPVITILGGGPCTDIPLREFAEAFSEVRLLDKDVESIKAARRRLPENLRKNVRLFKADLTGISDDTAIKLIETLKNSETVKDFFESIPHVIRDEIIPKVDRNFLLPILGNNNAAVFSHLVSSHESSAPIEYIGAKLLEKFGFGAHVTEPLARNAEFLKAHPDVKTLRDVIHFSKFLETKYASNPKMIYMKYISLCKELEDLHSLLAESHINLLRSLIDEEGLAHFADTTSMSKYSWTNQGDMIIGDKEMDMVDRSALDKSIKSNFKSPEAPTTWMWQHYTVDAWCLQPKSSEDKLLEGPPSPETLQIFKEGWGITGPDKVKQALTLLFKDKDNPDNPVV